MILLAAGIAIAFLAMLLYTIPVLFFAVISAVFIYLIVTLFNANRELEWLKDEVRSGTEKPHETEANLRFAPHLDAAFDQSAHYMALYNTNGEILRINRAIAKLSQVEQSKITGTKISEIPRRFITEESLALLADGIKRAGQGETVQMLLDLRQPDNEINFLDFSIRPILNNEGEILAILADGHDVTVRKRLEMRDYAFLQELKALQKISLELTQIEELDALYLHMVSASRIQLGIDRVALFLVDTEANELVGTYGTDPSGIITNESYYREFIGADHWTTEVLNTPQRAKFWENAPLYHDGKEIALGWKAVAALWDGHQAVGYLVSDNFIKKTLPRPYEAELISLLGSKFGHLIRLKQAQEAQRRTEAKLSATLNAIPDLIFRNHIDGTFLDIHAPKQEMLFSPVDQLLGNTISRVVPPELAAMTMRQLEAVNTTRLPSQFEYSADINGKNFTFEARMVPVGHEEVLSIIRDVTEIREVQRALAESVELYQLLAENISEAIALHEPDGRIAYMSPSITNISGYTPTELKAMTPDELAALVHPDDQSASRESLIRITGGETIDSIEWRLRRKDNVYTWLETFAKPIFDENGHISRFLVTSGEINARKSADLALRKSEARARALLKALPDTFFRMNNQGILLDYHSSSPERYTGEEQIIGKSVGDIVAPEIAERTIARVREALDSGQLQTFEYSLPIPEHGIQYYEARMMPSLPNEVAAVIRNITRRKQNEQLLLRNNRNLNTLYEVLLDLLSRRAVSEILQTVVDGVETLLESPYTELMLIEGEELVVKAHSKGMTFIEGDSVNPEDAPLSWKAYSTGELITVNDYSTWPQRRDIYSQVMLHAVAEVPIIAGDQRLGVLALARTTKDQPFTDEDLQIARMLSQMVALVLNNAALYESAISEIRERVAAENALNQANMALREFAYVISHDMKAPLRGIASVAGWLAMDYEYVIDAAGQNLLRLMQARVRRMEGMIDGVLAYSRIGRVEERRQSVDLNLLLEDIIELVAPPQNITLRILTRLPVIDCDPVSVGQVFQNIIDNAVKFMDKPEGVIYINCHMTDTEWEFSVQDNGPGIDARYFDTIFQIFQTLNPRDTIESTGIGLAIVKKIVESLGGKIRVDSQVGHGSTFTFSMPK